MSPEKTGNVNLVRKAIADKVPLYHIRRITGLDRVRSSRSIQYLRSIGELPHPTPDETRRAKQVSVSEAKGGISLLIEPYAQVGMSPTEIDEALRYEQNLEIGVPRIKSVLSKARVRGNVRALTEEEKKDSIKNSSSNVRLSIQANTRLWVMGIAVTRALGIDTSDWTRLDWKNWIKENEATIRQNRAEVVQQSRGAERKAAILKAIDEVVDSVEKDNPTSFAQVLIQEGFITDDPRFFDIAMQIAKKTRADWFTSPSKALIMTAFVSSRISEIRGSRGEMEHYMRLGVSVDSLWFNGAEMNEERRIARRELQIMSRAFSQ